MTAVRTRRERSRQTIDEYLLSEQELEEMYYYMLLARRLNERMLALQPPGPSSVRDRRSGQEAAQVGAAKAFKRGMDCLAPYYRDLGMNLVVGMTPARRC